MRTIRIGTRMSRLALEQARLMGDAIARTAEARGETIAYELVGMTTEGDRILDRPLDQIGGKGLFIRELDRAMLEGRIDIAVHSCKDLPAELDPHVMVGALSSREDPRDALVLPAGAPAGAASDWRALAAYLDETGLPVGCSSARRRVQLQQLAPRIAVESVRGNVNTRLDKLDGGSYGALVLAAAGLSRLGLRDRISRALSADEMVPAAGQGVMAATVARDADAWLLDLLAAATDGDSELYVAAERAFTRALGGDCATPCGAHAVRDADALALTGLYAAPDGSRVVRRSARVPLSGLNRDEVLARAAAAAEDLARAVREDFHG